MRYPIFVINLARHPRRFRFMEAQLGALGLVPIRVEAVNGTDPARRRRAAVAPYAPLTGGEVGCFESHRAVWQRVVDENLPGAVVLEDDAVVASDFATLDFPEDLLARADVIKLDEAIRPRPRYGKTEIALGGRRVLRRLWGPEYSTAGYFVTRRGAGRLLDMTRGYFLPIDRVMFTQNTSLFWKLEIWKLDPVAVRQLRYHQQGAALPGEISDSIQGDRTGQASAWETAGRLQMLRLRLRRFLDRDTRRSRDRRARAALAAAGRDGGLIEADIPFASPDMAHVARAEAEAFGP